MWFSCMSGADTVTCCMTTILNLAPQKGGVLRGGPKVLDRGYLHLQDSKTSAGNSPCHIPGRGLGDLAAIDDIWLGEKTVFSFCLMA